MHVESSDVGPADCADVEQEEASTHKSAKTTQALFLGLVTLTLLIQNKRMPRTYGGTYLCQVW